MGFLLLLSTIFLVYAVFRLWITTARLRERVDVIDGGRAGDLDDFEWLRQLSSRDRE